MSDFDTWYARRAQQAVDQDDSPEFLLDHAKACRDAWDAATEAAAKVADAYHTAANGRVESDPDDIDRHEECASTAGSIAWKIRALKKEAGHD